MDMQTTGDSPLACTHTNNKHPPTRHKTDHCSRRCCQQNNQLTRLYTAYSYLPTDSMYHLIHTNSISTFSDSLYSHHLILQSLTINLSVIFSNFPPLSPTGPTASPLLLLLATTQAGPALVSYLNPHSLQIIKKSTRHKQKRI